MKKTTKSVLFTILGIVGALLFIIAGWMIPIKMLSRQEDSYVLRELKYSIDNAVDDTGTQHELPINEGIVSDSKKADLNMIAYALDFYTQNPDLYVVREPYNNELSMEDADKKAREELEKMILYKILPDVGVNHLQLKSAELRGFSGKEGFSIIGGTAWPSGFWFISFESGSGDVSCSVVCDSQTGIIYSVGFSSDVYTVTDVDCYPMLFRFAAYLGTDGINYICGNKDEYYYVRDEEYGNVYRMCLDKNGGCEMTLSQVEFEIPPEPTNESEKKQ